MRPRRAPEPSTLFEAELRIHQVSKNNARRFRFITEKQSCSLIQVVPPFLNDKPSVRFTDDQTSNQGSKLSSVLALRGIVRWTTYLGSRASWGCCFWPGRRSPLQIGRAH